MAVRAHECGPEVLDASGVLENEQLAISVGPSTLFPSLGEPSLETDSLNGLKKSCLF